MNETNQGHYKPRSTKLWQLNSFIDLKRILFPCGLYWQIFLGPVPKSNVASHLRLNKVAFAGISNCSIG